MRRWVRERGWGGERRKDGGGGKVFGVEVGEGWHFNNLHSRNPCTGTLVRPDVSRFSRNTMEKEVKHSIKQNTGKGSRSIFLRLWTTVLFCTLAIRIHNKYSKQVT